MLDVQGREPYLGDFEGGGGGGGVYCLLVLRSFKDQFLSDLEWW